MADTWRQAAAPVVAEVIKRVGKEDVKKLRRELSAAYPFGEKANWPYKVWLSEIKRQLNPPSKPTPKAKDDTKTIDMFEGDHGH